MNLHHISFKRVVPRLDKPPHRAVLLMDGVGAAQLCQQQAAQRCQLLCCGAETM